MDQDVKKGKAYKKICRKALGCDGYKDRSGTDEIQKLYENSGTMDCSKAEEYFI